MKIVNSWNDFDPLKHVIVGRADNCCIAPSEPASKAKVWDMKRDGIPVLRGKQSKFIFIQMKERVNQNGFKVQNITVNVRGGLL